MRVKLSGALLCALTTTCSDALPRYTKVQDLRVLAIKAEPPELLFDGPESAAMSFEALVVDPTGGEIGYRWRFCPVESGRACMDFEDKLSRAQFVEFKAGLRALWGDEDHQEYWLSGVAQPHNPVSPSPPEAWWSQRGVWPYSVPPYPVDASTDLYNHHFWDNHVLGYGLGSWPSVVLDLTKGDQTLKVQKRVTLNIADLRNEAGSLGYTICPENEPPSNSQSGCIPLRRRTANSNPTFDGIEVSEGDDPRGDFTRIALSDPPDLAALVAVRAGEAIRIRPLFTPDSFEEYQTIKVDVESQLLFLEDLQEEISVAWFCSDGGVQDRLTWPKFTKSLDTVYTAPATRPPDNNGQVTVWMVARDGRGGVDWMSVEVEVLP